MLNPLKHEKTALHRSVNILLREFILGENISIFQDKTGQSFV